MLLSGELVRMVSMKELEQKAERGLEQMRGGRYRVRCRSCSGCLWRRSAKDNSWAGVGPRACFALF